MLNWDWRKLLNKVANSSQCLPVPGGYQVMGSTITWNIIAPLLLLSMFYISDSNITGFLPIHHKQGREASHR